MANKKEQRFRKLKKKHTWLSIIVYILIALMMHVFLSLFVMAFIYHMMDSKLSGEYKNVSYMAKLYESGTRDGSRDILKLLDEENGTYFITDAAGNVIYEHGENTCDTEGGAVKLRGFSENITVFSDTEKRFFYVGDNGYLMLDFPALRDWANGEGMSFADQFDEGRSNLELPIWISEDVFDDTERFVGKGSFSVNTRDLAILMSFTVGIAIMIFVITVIMIANIIGSIIGRRKLIDVFFTDEVTGNNNWMWFVVRGNQFLRKRANREKNFAVLDLVFVNYRNYCVCHSVEEGEELLCKVDDTVRKSIGKKEFCAHYASANFALLLDYRDEESLRKRIEELLSVLCRIDEGHRINFHVGVDVVGFEKDRSGHIVRRTLTDVEKEYNNACAARATLSDNDDNGIAFFNEKLVEEEKWLDIVQESQQRALDNEEFLVYYQPKYDPRTNALKGAEALVRWKHPVYGLISPGRFIPIFEKNGFITKIDHYMIRHVARDQKKWLDGGFSCVPVSVNVSRAHFIESDLAEQIRDMVDAEGTPHELIELELTESAFFDDKKALVETIRKLKSYGFDISMDDFGAGYSSLNSLKDMPLDVLKLDAEFFRGDKDDERGKIVVSEAVRLAKKLNMRTVAEGIEEKEQVEFLAEQGCDMIQGYIFAKPMTAGDYELRMKAGQAV